MPAETLPVLPLPTLYTDDETELRLPPDAENLFHRIIRDPTRPERTTRERRCTEMLCSVLINAPMFRNSILRWMAEIGNLDMPDPEEMEWEIDTEHPARCKRLDVIMRGWPPDEPEADPEVLWIVEVKTSSGLHESSEIQFEGQAEEEDTDTVSQIINYDRWLRQQKSRERGAFVLAQKDMTEKLPEELGIRWNCLTWAQLGRETLRILEEEGLPAGERLLARHMAGFIYSYLWTEDEMESDRLTFDHIALIRAMRRLGGECEDAVKSFLPIFVEALEEADLCDGEIDVPSQRFWGGNIRVQVKQPVLKDADTQLRVSVEGNLIMVWLRTSKNSEIKGAVSKAVQNRMESLQKRQPAWDCPEDREWHDVELRVPLSKLLHVEDQREEVRRIVTDALEDLKEVGLIEAIQEIERSLPG